MKNTSTVVRLTGSAGHTLSVDLAALAVGEDGQQAVAPQVGDSVEFTAAGKVTAIAGSQAEIALDTVNGQPLASASATDAGSDDSTPGEDNLEAVEAALRGRAAADDAQGY